MNKQEMYAFLKTKEIPHEITEHPAVMNMEDLGMVELPYPEAVAKNLFLRDDKRKQYYLITVKGEKRVNLKEFRKTYGTKPLTFASAEEMEAILQVAPGSVTPLALLNGGAQDVIFYLDEAFYDDPVRIGCHPNENTASVWLDPKDLVRLIEEKGIAVNIVPLG